METLPSNAIIVYPVASPFCEVADFSSGRVDDVISIGRCAMADIMMSLLAVM